MDRQVYDRLSQLALDARKYAYIPYSHYAVGAALLTADGQIFTGCNIENAAYSPTNCGERTAIFKAVSEGFRDFKAIAVAGGHEDAPLPLADFPPCGVCRQVMMEFCDPETFDVLLVHDVGDYRVMKLKELLPGGFGPANL
jgi:cytidine deaminase